MQRAAAKPKREGTVIAGKAQELAEREFIWEPGVKLGLPPEISQKACEIFRETRRCGISLAVSAAASLYAAVRISDCLPLSLRDLLRAYPTLRESSVNRVYRRYVLRTIDDSPKSCYFKPTLFALEIAKRLGFKGDARRQVLELSRRVERERLLRGKTPIAVAAAICYIAGQLALQPRSQKKVAEAAGVTEFIIRKHARALMKQLDLPKKERESLS